MTHDHYNIRNDIIEPIKEFLGVEQGGVEGKKGGFTYERILAEIKKPGIGIEIEDKKWYLFWKYLYEELFIIY